MTRLDILLSYVPHQARDTWVSMGQQEVDNNVRVYTINTVFRCVTASSPLNGAILFCDSNITLDPSFDWINYNISNRPTGDIMDQNMIIHPNIHIVLSQPEFQAITQNYDPTFIPFQETSLDLPVDIDDDELNRILIDTGVPFISIDELEYTKAQLMELCIKPAMWEYFKWFPIITLQRYGLSDSTFNIPIPSYAFGCGRVFVNPGYPVSTQIGNPLLFYFDETLMNISGAGGLSMPSGNSRSRRGFVDTQNYSTFIMERAARQGVINYSTRTRVRVNIQQGYVRGYTTKRGVLEIEWASRSTNWNDIPMNMQNQVREYATARIMRALAMLRMQARNDIPGTIDYSHFLTRADQLEKNTLELWKLSTKTSVIRV